MEENIVKEYELKQMLKNKTKETANALTEPGAKAPSPPITLLQPVKVSRSPPSLNEELKQLDHVFQSTQIAEKEKASSEKEEDAGIKAAEMYMPDDTQERKEIYAKLVGHGKRLGTTDLDALRGFFMFDGDETKGKAYLDNFATLRDLGFAESTIDQALIKCDNDQERALEELMLIKN